MKITKEQLAELKILKEKLDKVHDELIKNKLYYGAGWISSDISKIEMLLEKE